MKMYQKISMDDIIFEGRNKAYGAYELRQLSDRHSTIGLLTASAGFLLLLMLYHLYPSPSHPVTKPDIEVLVHPSVINLPKEVVKPKPIQHTPPPAPKTLKSTEINVVKNTIETPPPTQKDMNKYTASSTTHLDPAAGPAIPLETNGTGTGPAITENVKVNTNQIIDHAEVMPGFNGGTEALMDYLRKNIRPFSSDIENGLSGKVVIRFYVDTDGTVRNPEVLRDNIGGRCAEAAILAIQKMPKWKPGRQNGIPVKVYFTLPVTFNFTR